MKNVNHLTKLTEAADRIEELEGQLQAAAGMLSVYGPYATMHPQNVLDEIIATYADIETDNRIAELEAENKRLFDAHSLEMVRADRLKQEVDRLQRKLEKEIK